MGIVKLNKSKIRSTKPRGRPPKNVRYIYVYQNKMDYVKKVDELKLSGNLADNWRVFWQNFQIFATAIELKEKTEAVKVAIFLNAIGSEAVEVFNSLNISASDRQKYSAVTEAFEQFCKPKCNEVYESFVFHNRSQKYGEPFDNFLMDIKKIVRRCGFTDEDRMVRDRIVLGTCDKILQKRLLDTAKLTLEVAIDMARSAEASNQQVQQLQGEDGAVVDMVKSRGYWQAKRNHTREGNNDERMVRANVDCNFCGRKHAKGKCAAYGKICNNCKGKNHFSVVCKKRAVQQINTEHFSDSSVSSLYVDSIDNIMKRSKAWFENIKIQSENIQFKLDTGADVNILPLRYLKKLKNVIVEESSEKLAAYNWTKIESIGEVDVICSVRNEKSRVRFIVVVDDRFSPILGRESCVDLGLVKRINSVSEDDLLIKYKDVFHGLGCFKKDFSIELKENATPSSKPASRIPLALREKLKDELENLCKRDIIEKVDKPSSWVSNIVIVEKPNKSLRICINPRELNMAIKDNFYEIPTFEQIKINLVNKKLFSVFDLKEGFWQIGLDDKSKELCSFSTPFGCYRFKRLPFGIKIAPEAFQKLNEENFGDIPNVKIYIDDILISAENEQDHDMTVDLVMKRAIERNVKFNWNKIQFRKKEVLFLGHVISENGIGCDKNRLKGIEDLGAPKCKKDLQRLMGFINYLREYIPNLASVSTPLRELMKNSVVFDWLPLHDKCMNYIKKLIIESPLLKPFNEKEMITLQTDASKNGLGCTLLQDKRPVCFASRSLTDAETRYAQIEKEMLAVVFACQKFHSYIYGRNVEIVTDHKPLLGIMKKDYNKIPSSKLQRMKLRLEKYRLTFTYLPGKFLYLADWLSRSFSKKIEKEDEIKGLCEMVHTINVSDERKSLFQENTEKDEVLKVIMDYCLNGWPVDKNKLSFNTKFLWKIRNNLFLEDGLIFFDDRLYVPQNLRVMIMNHLHVSHLGIEKTKCRARKLLYWPNMNQDIESMVVKCNLCQKFRSANVKEPLLNHEIPNGPYEKIAMDVMDVCGKEYLVVGDYFSKYLDIIPLGMKTALAISQKLLIPFSIHGYPTEIIADNVPFGSFEFRAWAKELDIKVTTVSPRYPRSNGFAERMVQVAKKIVLKCTEEKSSIWQALLEYRNTPIKNSEFSPTELLMGRQTRTLVPGKNIFYKNSKICDKVKPVLLKNNNINKKHYDKNCKSRQNFEKGEKVWLKDNKHWVPGTIIEKHETPRSYIVEREGKAFRRSSYFLRSRI